MDSKNNRLIPNIDTYMDSELIGKYKDIIKANVLVIGPSGVGKSTLINEIFGKDICNVSHCKPCTQEFNYYDSHKYINIYDSKGLEHDTNMEQFIGEVNKFLMSKNNTTNPDEHIYIALYCLGESRLLDSDIQLLNTLKKNNVQPILVFTKSDLKQDDEIAGLKQTAKEYGLNMQDVFFIAAKDGMYYEDTSDEIKNGTAALLKKMIECAPDTYKQSLIMAQQVDINNKIEYITNLKAEAYKIITKAVGLAAAAGAIPIPGPDAVVITPVQLNMVKELAELYDFSVKECKEMILPLISQMAGTMIARNLVKFVPGLGSLVGATTAALFTGGMGYLCVNRFETRAISLAKGEAPKPMLFDLDSLLEFVNIFENTKK